MFTPIGTEALRSLVDTNGAQLVEVLPAGEYREEHLPGAVSIPLDGLDAESASSLDKGRPVVVYCFDYQ